MCTRGFSWALLRGPSTSPLGLKLARTFVTLFLAVSLAGCFPMRFVVRPGISGVVLDDTTSSPVASATVTLRSLSAPDGKVLSTTSTTTDANGAFVIPAKHVWWIYFAGADFGSYFGIADIDAPGFVAVSRKVRSSTGGPSKVRLGDVRVARAQ